MIMALAPSLFKYVSVGSSILRPTNRHKKPFLGVRFPDNWWICWLPRMWEFFLQWILWLQVDIVWCRCVSRWQKQGLLWARLMRTQCVTKFAFHQIVTQVCCCCPNLGHLCSTPAPFVSNLIGAGCCWLCCKILFQQYVSKENIGWCDTAQQQWVKNGEQMLQIATPPPTGRISKI